MAMTILHICWRDAEIHVWGEREASLKAGQAATADRSTGLSPFDAGAAELGSILQRLLWEEAELRIAPLTVSLPTVRTPEGDRPVPSRVFLMSGPDTKAREERRIGLQPWRVTAVKTPWKQAFALLGGCQEKRLADGVFAGEDLLACSELFRYAGALVARGKFLPDLRKTRENAYEACWRPTLDGAELHRLRSLASRMPPVVTGGQEPLRVTGELLEDLTDHLVRFSVVTTLSRAQAEHGKFYSVHDAWFSALRGETRTIRWESADELEALSRDVRSWRRPVEGRQAQGVALLFQLDEPEVPESPWALRVLLKDGQQAAEGGSEGIADVH